MPSKSPQQSRVPVSILAGLAVGLIVVSISESYFFKSTRSPQVADKAKVLPLVASSVSSKLTSSDRGNLNTATEAKAKNKQPVQLNSDWAKPTLRERVALKQAKVAVNLSQAQLAQARINLIEFKAKHDKAKILAAQGKVSRKQADLAVASYKLAQLQHNSAAIGLRDSQTQLIAAKAEVRSLGRKANTVKPM
jgi:acyl-CoA synthetase (AMP-forming)/AMP-acid ligase II